MTEIRYGKDCYHLHLEMINWAKDHLGPGGWTNEKLNDGKSWGVSIAFGNQTWYFKEESDATAFKLVWK